ncbi:unnamed protein product, partial [marine sediment metagenome]
FIYDTPQNRKSIENFILSLQGESNLEEFFTDIGVSNQISGSYTISINKGLKRSTEKSDYFIYDTPQNRKSIENFCLY